VRLYHDGARLSGGRHAGLNLAERLHPVCPHGPVAETADQAAPHTGQQHVAAGPLPVHQRRLHARTGAEVQVRLGDLAARLRVPMPREGLSAARRFMRVRLRGCPDIPARRHRLRTLALVVATGEELHAERAASRDGHGAERQCLLRDAGMLARRADDKACPADAGPGARPRLAQVVHGGGGRSGGPTASVQRRSAHAGDPAGRGWP